MILQGSATERLMIGYNRGEERLKVKGMESREYSSIVGSGRKVRIDLDLSEAIQTESFHFLLFGPVT